MQSYADRGAGFDYDNATADEQDHFLDDLESAVDSLRSNPNVDVDEVKNYLELPSRRRIAAARRREEAQKLPWYKRLFSWMKRVCNKITNFFSQLFGMIRSYLPKIMEFLQAAQNLADTAFNVATTIHSIVVIAQGDFNFTWRDVLKMIR